MRKRSIVLLLLCAAVAVTVHAQVLDEQAVKAALQDQILILREQTAGNPGSEQLKFDSAGHPGGSPIRAPFGISAVHIDQVKLTKKVIRIRGDRDAMLLQSSSSPVVWKPLPLHKIEITLALDPSHPDSWQSAVHAVFANSIEDALAGATDKDRQEAIETLPAPWAADSGPGPAKEKLWLESHRSLKSGPDITAPRVIYSVEPAYTRAARRDKVAGDCILQMVITPEGFPAHLRVQQGLPDGLTESAIATVSQYRFKPALRQGRPFPALLITQVNFHLF